MEIFNKAEQAIIDSVSIEKNSNYELSFKKTGKVKDNTIRYTYSTDVCFFVPWGIGYRRICDSDEFTRVEEAVEEAVIHYQKVIDSGFLDYKFYIEDDGQRFICGSHVYGVGADLKIYIGEVGEATKLYVYPNGDVAIFMDDTKYIIANSPLLYLEFQLTDVYEERYMPIPSGTPTGGVPLGIIFIIVVVLIILFFSTCL